MFFPNSFSYGVLANVGSGSVPGRLPNHGFRGFWEGSGVPIKEVLGQVLSRVPEGSGASGFQKVPGQVPGKAPRFRMGFGGVQAGF